MVTLLIILIVLGLLMFVVCAGAMVLLDPIIAILIIWGSAKLISKIASKKKG